MSLSSQNIYIGVDLGTASVKISAIDGNASIIATTGAGYTTHGLDQRRAEQDPRDWIRAITEAMKALLAAGIDKDQVAGIGLSAQMPTFVLATEDGSAAANAIVWSDPRADSIGADLLAVWGEKRHYDATGVVLDGRYIVPMYKWMEEHNPERIPDKRWILSAKDFVHFWLTGRPATDPSTASGFGVYAIREGAWDEALCAAAGIDARELPEILPSHAVSGSLREKAARDLGLPSGVPVVNGAADSVAAVLGMGGFLPGHVCQMSGSSTAIIAVHDACLLHPGRKYLVTPLATPGVFGLEADILSTGTAIAWLQRLLGCESITSLAEKAPPGSDGVMFFPYLAGGEQGVLWDPDRTGGIQGLGLSHGPECVARALLEGIAFEAARCLRAFGDAGFSARRLTCAGPITREPFFMRLMADVSGLECGASASEHASALGAALLAGVGLGAWSMEELDAAAGARDARRFAPDPDSHKRYARLYETYALASETSRAGRSNGKG